MCPWRALVCGLLTCLFVGCATESPAPATSWLSRLRPFQGPTGNDVIQMDVALLECPAGDRYLNEDLWPMVDEQVVALERRGPLEDNGLRIGQLGGITPAGLHTLLTSERSCANPRRIQLRAGNSHSLVLGPTLPQCRFQIDTRGEPMPVELEQAQCTLLVVPTLTNDGRTKLQFTPQISHGEPALVFRPAAQQAGWMLDQQRPTESYTTLGWEVSLAPNEYLLIGGRFDRCATLGQQCFVRCAEARPVQRLLVIRTGRSLPGVANEPALGASDETAIAQPPPLAYQASVSAARGSSR